MTFNINPHNGDIDVDDRISQCLERNGSVNARKFNAISKTLSDAEEPKVSVDRGFMLFSADESLDRALAMGRRGLMVTFV